MIEKIVAVEPMADINLSEVYSIEEKCFPEPWSKAQFKQELRSTLSKYFVAKSDDRIVGYVGVMFITDEAHLTTIAVCPDWQHKGIGSMLLLKAADLAIERGMRIITLEVRVSNETAINMYKKFGFEVAGRRIGYYSKIGEDALIMDSPDLRAPSYRQLLNQIEKKINDARR